MFKVCSELKISSLAFLLAIFIIAAFVSVAKLTVAQTSTPRKVISLELYHKFNDQSSFKPRGTIKINPATEFKPAKVIDIKQNKLTKQDLEHLVSASKNGGLYYLLAKQVDNLSSSNNDSYHQSQIVVKSCSLLASKFRDLIEVNLNINNEFLGINHYTDSSKSVCNDKQQELDLSKEGQNYNLGTTVKVESIQTGPIPETATYIKRLEEELSQKLKGDKADNRSFFAKYWMYIVPAVFILMFASGPAPEQGTNGGR